MNMTRLNLFLNLWGTMKGEWLINISQQHQHVKDTLQLLIKFYNIHDF